MILSVKIRSVKPLWKYQLSGKKIIVEDNKIVNSYINSILKKMNSALLDFSGYRNK